MNSTTEKTGLQLRSLVKKSGELELSLVSVPMPVPQADEVVVRIEGSPINPSDLGLLFGAADMSTARRSGTAALSVITARIPAALMKGMAGRLEQSMPVGNEGAGVVVDAGASDGAQALLGKTVAIARRRHVRPIPLREGHGNVWCSRRHDAGRGRLLPSSTRSPRSAWSKTMRREGHKRLVHTAAASNLGQMLNNICLAKDGIALVNIVRSARPGRIAARHWAPPMCAIPAAPGFMQDLTEALAATGATLAFDAIGGGKLAGQILTCMEAAAESKGHPVQPLRLGHKQVYIYGGLEPARPKSTAISAWPGESAAGC